MHERDISVNINIFNLGIYIFVTLPFNDLPGDLSKIRLKQPTLIEYVF